ncbi:Hpt domain-containing protein [Eubacterium oxidoreducens]|uniref:HPt (Histidine-containing phosphotransfer) domain-containing protein n=1 Tax=Eubacterium oxidoreducens TaxID=1732 RepID=A0A1G6AWP0_EUBOX|nr:Hpt domain-containing protein [Eubacterium oxidoreducens]SDB12653.1 HPt (histidine-containing phosphotransfer) domain-containing protein [Eubacterium oxidoreducens]
MNLKDCYEAIGGDYDDVMSRLPKEDLVEKFLKKLVEGEEYGQLLNAVQLADYKSVFAASHTLKGVCANLGLKELCEVVSQLCENVRGGEPKEDITPLVDAVKKQYLRLKENVTQL